MTKFIGHVFFIISFGTIPLKNSYGVERLCFNSEHEVKKAIPIIETILVKDKDRLEIEGPCLNVTISPERGELFQRWIRHRLPDARWEFSGLEAPTPMCDMLVRKLTRKTQTQQGGVLHPGGIQVSAGDGEMEEKEQSFLKVKSGHSAQLWVEGELLDITCTKKGRGHYQLKISMRSTNAFQSGTALSTEIEAPSGEEINLGTITRELKQKSRIVNVPSEAHLQHIQEVQNAQWFLKVTSD